MPNYKNMSYSEFLEYCEDNRLYNTWSYEEATICLSLIEEIEKIKIRTFGFISKKKTKRAKELIWEFIRDSF